MIPWSISIHWNNRILLLLNLGKSRTCINSHPKSCQTSFLNCSRGIQNSQHASQAMSQPACDHARKFASLHASKASSNHPMVEPQFLLLKSKSSAAEAVACQLISPSFCLMYLVALETAWSVEEEEEDTSTQPPLDLPGFQSISITLLDPRGGFMSWVHDIEGNFVWGCPPKILTLRNPLSQAV